VSAIQCASASDPEGVEERKLAARAASTMAGAAAGVHGSTTSTLVLVVALLTLSTKLLGLDEVKALLQRVVSSTTDDAEAVLGGAGLGVVGRRADEQSRIACRGNVRAVDCVVLCLLDEDGCFGMGEGELPSAHQGRREVAILGASSSSLTMLKSVAGQSSWMQPMASETQDTVN
jgi:hypothetical protein